MRYGRSYTGSERTTRIRYCENRDDIFAYLREHGENSFFVIDEAVEKLFPTKRLPPYCVTVTWKDRDKTPETLSWLLNTAAGMNCGKTDRWIAIGGGALTDMVTAAASLYLGGVPLTLVPTTITAMTDAAIGGRAGLHIAQGRNFMKTVYPADDIIIDPIFIHYLPDTEIRNGLGELIRFAFISKSDELLRILVHMSSSPRHTFNTLTRMIELGIDVKLDYLELAEDNPSIRHLLGFGHNLSEIMKQSGTRTKGECTVWGMATALEMGVAMGITSPQLYETFAAVANGFRFDIRTRFSRAEVDKMRVIKGVDGEDVLLTDFEAVLLKKIGEPVIVSVPYDTFIHYAT